MKRESKFTVKIVLQSHSEFLASIFDAESFVVIFAIIVTSRHMIAAVFSNLSAFQ